MPLYDKILRIQFDEGLGVNDFVEKVGFSKGLYYDIKSGHKTELSPVQSKLVTDVFPKITQEWLCDKSDKVVLVEDNKPNSIEDVIAKKVVELLKPLFKERDDKIDDVSQMVSKIYFEVVGLKEKSSKENTNH